MIWTRGRVIADDELTISVLDRTFEHGLGLFETLRTWNRKAPFLDEHRRRLLHSVLVLGLTIDPSELPDEAAVNDLLAAEQEGGDRLLRITLSGGLSSQSGAVVWMRSGPLPEPVAGGARLGGFWNADRHDPLSRHKTLNYWRRRLAHEQARAAGADEWLSCSADGAIWEGSRTSLFAVMDSELWTPPLEGPIVPGIFRSWVVAWASESGVIVRESEFDRAILATAAEVFLTNSVRGVIPVAEVLGNDLPHPNPVTDRIQVGFLNWLAARGME